LEESGAFLDPLHGFAAKSVGYKELGCHPFAFSIVTLVKGRKRNTPSTSGTNSATQHLHFEMPDQQRKAGNRAEVEIAWQK
jgi:hypothetical protein